MALAAVLCVLATSACGTRLSDAEIGQVQAATVTVTNPATALPGAEAGGGTAAGAGNVAGAAGSAEVVPQPGSGEAAAASGAAGPAAVSAAGVSGGSTTASVTGAKPGTSKAAAAGAAAGERCTRALEPIILGQTGVFSGLVGQSTGNQRLGMSVWSNWVNANGGIRCHPVKLYQMDDGSDPSRTAANVNELVTTKKAIALVGVNVPITMGAARSAAARLGVPIVGGDAGDAAWNTDPNLFLSGGSSAAAWSGGIVEAARETGFTKLGLIYCIEASPCQQMNQYFAQTVEAAGAQDVFRQSVSLTQSDYTAECQNAKNAGVQIMAVYVDAASIQRFVRSCKSIDYRPVMETGGLAISPGVPKDPDIQAFTLYVGSPNAPYTATGTPGLDTLHTAFRTHTGADVPDAPSLIGWAAGMLFKGAIDSLDVERVKGAVTTAMVYDGLYSLKDKTLGGLAPPLVFKRGQPSGVIPCYTYFKITTQGIQTPGAKFRCINSWKRN
ncbi:hypothetical protein GCM10009547_28690 [Sporichthya brevicatena]|uniref:Leucine-binding protein domain-containing protein n=1 Tax=Sporichthya brevicatena TaxID=171442 RepID=A0ABN1GYT9_9ACTN